MANEMIVSEQAQQFMPVMPMVVAVQRRAAIVEFTKQIMVKDTDFGVIPGTGSKPSLLKPGAEKLCSFFGLAPVFVPVETIEDWTGIDHDNEAFFLYRYRCELYRNGTMIGSGVGSCNSWESKYRYRNGKAACPECGAEAILRSKFPPRNRPNDEPGWYCNQKAGGCGAAFDATDKRITEQSVGKVKNPDPADVVNTIDKMAQKRALVAATLIAVNASEFFTQDVEDMASGYVDATYTVVTEPPTTVVSEPPTNGTPVSSVRVATGKSAHEPATTTNGNGKSDAAMFKRYNEAKDAARKSGKFNAPKHLENAWSKMFKEMNASDTANGDAFLAAWAEYVANHEVSDDDSVPAEVMQDAPEMAF